MTRRLFTHHNVVRNIKLNMGTTSQASWKHARRVFGNRCAYCLRSAPHFERDHVIPLSRGGYDVPANVVPACERCNQSKGHHDVRFWMRSMGYNFDLFFLRWSQMRRFS